MDEQTTPPALQLALPIEDPALPLDQVRAMRRLFMRRWRPWHRCKRFEDAMADPITRRLLALAVSRPRPGPSA